MANREMVELWNGPASEAWVLAPQRYDGMLEHLGRLALDAAALQPGLAALREAVAPRMTDEGLRLGAAVWVVRAARGG